MSGVFSSASEKKLRQKLRKSMPKAEIILWSRLRRKQLRGTRFRRQHSVGPYVIDFYCPALKLAIEVDGESHTETKKPYDDMRQHHIERYGIRFLRYTNSDVYENLDGVLNNIWATIKEMQQELD